MMYEVKADERSITLSEKKAQIKVIAYLNTGLEDAGLVANLLEAMLKELGFDVTGLVVRIQGGEEDG